jgi:hypothetical protein
MRLTIHEIKLVAFILTALVAGALVKQYRATHHPAIPPAPSSSRTPKI